MIEPASRTWQSHMVRLAHNLAKYGFDKLTALRKGGQTFNC